MEEILKKIHNTIGEYESGAFVTEEKLRELSRDLSSSMYHLTKYNIEAYNKWNSLVFNSDKSVAAAKVEADYKCPELRLTRKILEAARNVAISINSELKIIKDE